MDYHRDYDFDGYIQLDHQEMSRFKNGDAFVSVVRPATENSMAKYGYPGDTLGATEADSLRPEFNVRVVSNFVSNGKWITVLHRLKSAV